jgi:hypothetical protein
MPPLPPPLPPPPLRYRCNFRRPLLLLPPPLLFAV